MVSKRITMAYLQEHLTFDQAQVVTESAPDGISYGFLYKWTEISTGKWYVGSRTAKGCHINDGYLCSSKVVRPMISESPNNWKREILCVGNPKYIVQLEAKYLKKLNAKNDSASYNYHNGDGKFTTTGMIMPNDIRKKMSKARVGKPLSEEHRKKIGDLHRGKTVSEETRRKIGIASRGREYSEDARKKCSHPGEKNPMYGKRHSLETRKLMSENRKLASLKRTGPIKGYWISPDNEKFETLAQAHAIHTDISTTTIRVWSINNKNGWSFEKLKENIT